MGVLNLDLEAIGRGDLSLFELVQREKIDKEHLRRMTNRMIDHMLALIADCTDADVVFVPSDPEANDTFASTQAEVHLAWTLGHVIVHVTASAEESAFLAAELARGVQREGRSRYETPWQAVTTIQECRERLEDSRRMRLATLEVWGQPPHLDNTYSPRPGVFHNAVSRFVAGLTHDEAHVAHIENIVKQAKAARSA